MRIKYHAKDDILTVILGPGQYETDEYETGGFSFGGLAALLMARQSTSAET